MAFTLFASEIQQVELIIYDALSSSSFDSSISRRLVTFLSQYTVLRVSVFDFSFNRRC